MAGAKTGAVLAVEEFVEGHVIAPLRIALEKLAVAKHGAAAASRLIAQENASQPSRQLVRDLAQREMASRAAWMVDLQVIAVIAREGGDGLNEEEVHREPDRSPPIG